MRFAGYSVSCGNGNQSKKILQANHRGCLIDELANLNRRFDSHRIADDDASGFYDGGVEAGFAWIKFL